MFVFIGEASSLISSACSYLLSSGTIPQISYASTSPLLSDSKLHPNFLRTIPSDLQQITFLVKYLLKMKWSYVSVLASDDDNGRIAMDILRQATKKNSICFALEKLFNQNMTVDEMKNLLNDLKHIQNRSEVIIIWATDFEFIKTIVRESAKMGLHDMLWIVMTETSESIFKYRPEFGQNIIMLNIEQINVKDFITHKDRIEYESTVGNKWIEEYWTSINFCPKHSNDKKPEGCINFKPTGFILGHRFSENVIASVYVFAHGLHKILGCNEESCVKNVYDNQIDYEKLKHEMLRPENKVRIPSSDFIVNFETNGDLSTGTYHFKLLTNIEKPKEFGKWDGKRLNINKQLFWEVYSNSTKGKSRAIRATCSLTCQPGFYRVNQTSPCCWSCYECPYNEVSLTNDSKGCQKCGMLEVPSYYKNKCIPLDNSKFSFDNLTGICIGVISVFGMLYFLLVMLVYGVFWETPGVKSTNREMSMIQILSLFLLLLLPVLYLFEVKELCMARLVMFGSLHSTVLIFVLLKTYRLWRLFQPHFFKKHIRLFLSLPTQVSISFIILLLQLVFFAVWYCLHQPSIILYTNTFEKKFIYHCGVVNDYLLYAIIVYVLILALASGFIAFRARSLPENFNEAQCIWLAMFTYCILWFSFFLLHLSGNELHRPTVLLCVNMTSTFVLGVTLYGNKIRMLICFPHLNNKTHFTGLSGNANVRTFSVARFSRKEASNSSQRKKSRQKNTVISFSFDDTM